MERSDVTIIHLSDFHVGEGKNDEHLRVLLTKLGNRYEKENAVIIITGDLFHSKADFFGKKQNRNRQRTEEIFKETKFKENFPNCLICPGNHDIPRLHWGKNLELDGYFFDLKFPRVDVVDDVRFIGLDSGYERLLGFSRGSIGKDPTSILEEILKKNEDGLKNVVYLHHNPVVDKMNNDPRKVLMAGTKFLESISGKVDAVLSGHTHFFRRYTEIEEKYKIGAVVASGKSTKIIKQNKSKKKMEETDEEELKFHYYEIVFSEDGIIVKLLEI